MKTKKEEDLRKEAERLNGLLSKNDAQNWRYKVAGRRGDRTRQVLGGGTSGARWREESPGERRDHRSSQSVGDLNQTQTCVVKAYYDY